MKANICQVQPSKPLPAKLSSEYSYLVVGGSGGIGRELVRQLARLGAKNIVTLSRSGSNSDSVRALMEEMRNVGVNLLVHKGSVSNVDDVHALKLLTSRNPIRGIIQAAMVLQVKFQSFRFCRFINT
jgi:NAD(P)-dependent dehydrogenase (short-subunit alcohol dehydrogenase family)